MKRWIKCIGIGMVVNMLLATSIYSQTNSQPLTIEEAKKIAYSNNYTLKIAENEIDKYDELRKKADDGRKYVNFKQVYDKGNGVSDQMLQQVTVGVEKAGIGQEGSIIKYNTTKDFIDFGIESSFLNIKKVEGEILVADKKIENLKEKEKIARIKKESGYDSEYNYKDSRINRDKAEQDKKVSEENLKIEYEKLNKLLGFSENEIKRPLEFQSLQYSPLKDKEGEVKHRIAMAIETDPTVWQKQKEAEIADLNVKLYVFNGNALNDPSKNIDPYAVQELNATIADNQVSNTKQEIENTVRTTYNNIKKLETMYDSLKEDQKKLDEAMKVTKAKIDAGMGIKQELSDLELKRVELENGLQTIVINHEILKKVYQKPFLYSAISK